MGFVVHKVQSVAVHVVFLDPRAVILLKILGDIEDHLAVVVKEPDPGVAEDARPAQIDAHAAAVRQNGPINRGLSN